MGYNLHTRCITHGESAYVSRSHESHAIKLWLSRHRSDQCVVEWAVDNTYSTPDWVDGNSDLYLPDDLLVQDAEFDPIGYDVGEAQDALSWERGGPTS